MCGPTSTTWVFDRASSVGWIHVWPWYYLSVLVSILKLTCLNVSSIPKSCYRHETTVTLRPTVFIFSSRKTSKNSEIVYGGGGAHLSDH